MEKIIAKLESYLESKRLSFPRFYLLSNDELIDILSQSRNPQAIQVHLQKCFEGMESLDFGEDPKSIVSLSLPPCSFRWVAGSGS